MKFRPNAKLNAGQVVDRRGLPNAGAPIDPLLKTIALNNINGGSGPVYVPGGHPFPWLGDVKQSRPPGSGRNLVAKQLGMKPKRKRPA